MVHTEFTLARVQFCSSRQCFFLNIFFPFKLLSAFLTLPVFCSFLNYSTLPFHSLLKTLLPLCDQILSSRLWYYQESAFPSQSVYGELPIGGDWVVSAQEEAADPKPADPAQPQRTLRWCKRPGHQDPAQEMQLPQKQRVSTCPNTINLSGKCQKANVHTTKF